MEASLNDQPLVGSIVIGAPSPNTPRPLAVVPSGAGPMSNEQLAACPTMVPSAAAERGRIVDLVIRRRAARLRPAAGDRQLVQRRGRAGVADAHHERGNARRKRVRDRLLRACGVVRVEGGGGGAIRLPVGREQEELGVLVGEAPQVRDRSLKRPSRGRSDLTVEQVAGQAGRDGSGVHRGDRDDGAVATPHIAGSSPR